MFIHSFIHSSIHSSIHSLSRAGKFLTATDRGIFTVTDGGSKKSIFKAKPRYRFREDGDGVLFADEVS